MRLIDADDLIQLLIINMEGSPLHRAEHIVNEMLTVDAIPISFIRDKIEKIKTVISDIYGVQGFEDITRLLIHKAIYLERLIEEWEMENERKEE